MGSMRKGKWFVHYWGLRAVVTIYENTKIRHKIKMENAKWINETEPRSDEYVLFEWTNREKAWSGEEVEGCVYFPFHNVWDNSNQFSMPPDRSQTIIYQQANISISNQSWRIDTRSSQRMGGFGCKHRGEADVFLRQEAVRNWNNHIPIPSAGKFWWVACRHGMLGG